MAPADRAPKVVFGDCAFDPAARELRRQERRVDLPPRMMELLLALLEARPRALSRAELHDRLWPDTCVSSTSLHNVVAELRKAIGDDPREPLYVRTIHRYGYAFCGQVRQPEGEPPAVTCCSLRHGPQELPLYEGENLIGRTPEAVVRIASDRASRRHARIVVGEGHAVLEDLGSKNGTLLNGRLVEGSLPLQDGDEILMGRQAFVFGVGSSANTTKTDRTG
jgi:DNA-binding winged helix-turn-helix (wHTH) protein